MRKLLEVINFKKHVIYGQFRKNAKKLLSLLHKLDDNLNYFDDYRYFNKDLEPVIHFPKKLFNNLKNAIQTDLILKKTEKIIKDNGEVDYYVISKETYAKTVNEYFFNKLFSFLKQRGRLKNEDRNAFKNKILSSSEYESSVALHSIYHDFLHFLLNPKHDEIMSKYSSDNPLSVPREEYISDLTEIMDEIIVFFVQGTDYGRYEYVPNIFVEYLFYAFAVEFVRFLIEKKVLNSNKISDIYMIDSREISKEITNFIFSKTKNPKNKHAIIMRDFFMKLLMDLKNSKIDTIDEFNKMCILYTRSNEFVRDLNDILDKYVTHSNLLDLEIFETIDEFNEYVLNIASELDLKAY